jgi:hypothetical protein
MVESRYIAALEAYREGTRGAIGGPSGALEAQPADGSQDDVLIRSQELEDAAAVTLSSGDGDVRELAALQLAGGAALDLAAAVDLLAPSALEAAGGGEFERTYAELQDVLQLDPALGARATVPPAQERALEAGGTPLEELRGAAHASIDGIAADATKIAGYAVDGFIALPADALLGGLAAQADKLLGPVFQELKGAARLAVRLVAKAVSKLLRLLGPAAAPARKWLSERLGDLIKDKATAFFVGRALQVDDVRREVTGMIDGASPAVPGGAVDGVRKEVASLASRFGRHEHVIAALAKVLGKVRGILIGLVAWAAAAVAGVYALMLAYGIWVAGDFLDWQRTTDDGRLDLVAGVRSTVRLGVAA